MNIRKVRFAWKYRKYLWKYRGVIRRRKEIAGWTAAGVALAAGGCAYWYIARARVARASTPQGA